MRPSASAALFMTLFALAGAPADAKPIAFQRRKP